MSSIIVLMYSLLNGVRSDKHLMIYQVSVVVLLFTTITLLSVAAMERPTDAQHDAAVKFVQNSLKEQFRIAMIVGDALGISHVYVYSKDIDFNVDAEVSVDGRTYRYKRSDDAVGVLSVAAQNSILDADDFFALAPGPRSRVKDGVIVVPANLRDYFRKQERKSAAAGKSKN